MYPPVQLVYANKNCFLEVAPKKPWEAEKDTMTMESQRTLGFMDPDTML
jgi:hypothetical protein